MAYIRKIRTTSGAIAVQICEKRSGKRVILEHVGSAHSVVELALLESEARKRLVPEGQQELDLGLDVGSGSGPASDLVRPVPTVHQAKAVGSVSRVLWEVLENAYAQIGFDIIDDAAFKQLVLARVVEPTSKNDTPRVLASLGVPSFTVRTFHRCLERVVEHDYQDAVCRTAFKYATRHGCLALALFDTTTLHFESEKADGLRGMGRSKEGRFGPQVQYGLLTDRTGFPLEFVLFPGNKGETRYFIPTIQALVARHGSELKDLVVVADAGILSAANCAALEDLGLYFIVGSKSSSARQDLLQALPKDQVPSEFMDGQIFETTRVMTHQRQEAVRRVVYQYREKRAARDRKVLADLRDYALKVQSQPSRLAKAKFVTVTGKTTRFNESLYDQAVARVGLKGYVTNLPESFPGSEIVAWYADLFQIERSFRMTKSDLAGRPFHHYTANAIQAHLVIVFTALAVARYLQTATGTSIKQILKDLKPLCDVTIEIAGTQQTLPSHIPEEFRHYLKTEPGH